MSSGNRSERSGARRWAALLCTAVSLAAAIPARALDVSPPPILQWFESSYQTIEARTPDLFMAGYGFLWLPPPYRADTGDQSVGYDVYDRFDLGRPGRPTLYGTETGLRTLASMLHRAGVDLHVDFVMNHNGYSKLDTPGFVGAGGYPGLAITLKNDIDGDFHSAFAFGVQYERLAGLIDIAHEKNYQFIRTPVNPDDDRNIRAGKTPAFGRLANVPDAVNRRFYPDQGHNTMFLFDPKTGQGNIPVHAFNLKDPLAGDPVPENGMGYLMRNAQWLVQVIGVDGLRIDAAKHVPGFVLDFIDRAVYRTSPRRLLNGGQKHVFSYSEVYDANPAVLLPHVRKDINPADPGRIGGNRDTLDFRLYFALKDNLEATAKPNAWQTIKNAALDVADDPFHNGSAGVTFTQSHDVFKPFALEHVAQAYTLMMPGNTVVYFNGKEFGERDFPKPGRGDALSVGEGSLLTRLVQARNTHGRGDYAERWDGTDGLFAFERQSSAIVLLSNRGDAGFDSRTLTNVAFAPGTLLVELTGNAADKRVNPERGGGQRDIPQVLRVFSDGGVSKVNVRFQRPGTIGRDGKFDFHGRGLLVYGLAAPSAPRGIELTNVAKTLPGEGNPPNDRENGRRRQTDISVITSDTFEVKLKTHPVRLLGSNALRDVWADGDQALLRIDQGRDVNGNGVVDFTTPGDTAYGFERFRTKSSPLIGAGSIGGPRGDGEFRQVVNAAALEEGVHFITARAWRHRTDNGPAVFADFKRVIYVDRLPPRSDVATVRRVGGGAVEIDVRSLDGTAERVHAFVDLPAGTSDEALQARIDNGDGRMNRVDRDLFRANLANLGAGDHTLTIATFEPTGRKNVQRENFTAP
jgi:glycosidase